MLNRTLREIANNSDLIMNTLNLTVKKTLELATDLEEIAAKDRALTAALKALRPKQYQKLADERSAQIREIAAELSKEQETNSDKESKENSKVRAAIQQLNNQKAEAIVSKSWEKENEYQALLREFDEKGNELLDQESDFKMKSKILHKDLPEDAKEIKPIAKYLIHLM